MGLIILPFLLGALVAGIISIFHMIKHLKAKEIGVNEIGLGIIALGVLFGLVCLSYIVQGSVWALDGTFRFPIVMILLPYSTYYTIIKERKMKNPKMILLAKSLLICTVLSSILGLLYSATLFDIPKLLGVFTHY